MYNFEQYFMIFDFYIFQIFMILSYWGHSLNVSYTIIKDENNWWNYARMDANGKLASTGQRVGQADAKILGVKTHLHPTIKVTELLIGNDHMPDIGSFDPSKISKPEHAPQTGTKKALVILINFTDVSQDPGSTSPYYQNLLFNASSGANSMNNYFKEVSYNKIDITGDVAGNKWFRASNNLSWYGADISGIDEYEYGDPDPNNWYIFKLAKEAVIAADPYVNYAQYDNNSDGVIDNLIIVHSGNGQESSGVSTDIWSHKWSIYVCSGSWNLGYMTNDGVKAVGYTMLAENSPLGTFAHEFGHDLGLPDLYDTDTSNGASEGIGEWGLMGTGGWLGSPSGSSPAHLSAWSKYFLGWVNLIKVTSTLLNEQINQAETNDDIYMILDNPGDTPGNLDWSWSGTGNGEYFLVENRRKTGYDAYLPSEGLLIWHIDESRGNNTDETHKLVDLEEADGLNDLDNNINRGDANDPWYNSLVGFIESTNPNSKLYNGSASGVRVTNISASASIMTANLIVSWPLPIITFASPTPDNNSYLLQNWVYVKITSDETLNTALLEWNGTNETMLGSGTTRYKNKTALSDGNHSYRVWGNDSTNNWNVTEIKKVMIDTAPPVVTANPTGYLSGYSAAKNGTSITLNASISDYLAGVKNATVNASQINSSLGIAILNNISRFYTNSTVIVNTSDGTYRLNITAYDNAGNLNDIVQIPVIVDNTPPGNITVTPVSYQRGSAANNRNIMEFNASADDPVINLTSAGLKNASVNASQINNTGRIELTNQSGFWRGNATFDKFIADGNYSLNVTFFDNAGNINNSVQINVTIDNTPPSVSDVSLSSPFINVTGFTNISANITSLDTVSQVNQSEVFARITYPNDTSINYNMSGGSTFYHNFTDTAQYGRFNVTILANDTTGNTNSTQETHFVTTFMTINTSIGSINITQSKVNITSNEFTNNPGIYVLIDISDSIKTNLSYMVISVNYTDAEVSSLVESSLRLHRWNTTNATSPIWDKLSGAGSPWYVNNAGVDTNNNFVWANMTKLCEFGVSGNLYVPPAQQYISSGGGGGGGPSGENYTNIEVKENYDLHIFIDKVTSYRYTNRSNPVMFVNITGNINAGEINAAVEVLRNTSTLIKPPTSAPGIVYKNVNIWVGTTGFAVPKNIKIAAIKFKVLNTWLESNSIAANEIRMVRWDGSKWVTLDTGVMEKDSTNTYYEATTYTFSPYAITGLAHAVAVTETPTKQAETATATAVPAKNGIPGFEATIAISVIALLAASLRNDRKRR